MEEEGNCFGNAKRKMITHENGPHPTNPGPDFFAGGNYERAIMALFHFLSQTHSIIVGVAITATSLSEKGRPSGLTDDQKYCPASKILSSFENIAPNDQKYCFVSKVLPNLKKYCPTEKSIAQPPKVLSASSSNEIF